MDEYLYTTMLLLFAVLLSATIFTLFRQDRMIDRLERMEKAYSVLVTDHNNLIERHNELVNCHNSLAEYAQHHPDVLPGDEWKPYPNYDGEEQN